MIDLYIPLIYLGAVFYVVLVAINLQISCGEHSPNSEQLFIAILWPLFLAKFLIYHFINGFGKAMIRLLSDWNFK